MSCNGAVNDVLPSCVRTCCVGLSRYHVYPLRLHPLHRQEKGGSVQGTLVLEVLDNDLVFCSIAT